MITNFSLFFWSHASLLKRWAKLFDNMVKVCRRKKMLMPQHILCRKKVDLPHRRSSVIVILMVRFLCLASICVLSVNEKPSFHSCHLLPSSYRFVWLWYGENCKWSLSHDGSCRNLILVAIIQRGFGHEFIKTPHHFFMATIFIFKLFCILTDKKKKKKREICSFFSSVGDNL